MAHEYHASLDGYDPDQLLHDGCAECEDRGEHVHEAIARLDDARFEHAWHRAGELQLHGVHSASRAELPMLRALAAIQVQLERRGWDIGIVPLDVAAR